MMEILEAILWIIATPILLFIGLSFLGFILGLISDPYYGVKDARRAKRAMQIKNWIKKIRRK